MAHPDEAIPDIGRALAALMAGIQRIGWIYPLINPGRGAAMS
jgi:hypothetical protein